MDKRVDESTTTANIATMTIPLGAKRERKFGNVGPKSFSEFYRQIDEERNETEDE